MHQDPDRSDRFRDRRWSAAGQNHESHDTAFAGNLVPGMIESVAFIKRLAGPAEPGIGHVPDLSQPDPFSSWNLFAFRIMLLTLPVDPDKSLFRGTVRWPIRTKNPWVPICSWTSISLGKIRRL